MKKIKYVSLHHSLGGKTWNDCMVIGIQGITLTLIGQFLLVSMATRGVDLRGLK